MKQLTLHLRTGAVSLQEVPVPVVKAGHLLIKTRKSLLSAGTEQMLVDFGKSTLLRKALKQAERLNEVWNKIRHDGLSDTYHAVQYQMDRLVSLGYCNAGEVIAVGEDVTNFRKGDRVISNGPHAQIVRVPASLAAKVPENITDEDAVFTVLGAVALQGIRLLGPALGEIVAVIGLGLVGQLTAQLLKINGCQVIGVDPDEARLSLAKAEIQTVSPAEAETYIHELTRGKGVDGVIIAAASRSSDIIKQAARISRQRGKIILTGSVGAHFSRADFYKKELTFQVSCSYGPGRYDPRYEQEGIDYPYAFVRWTENRNFEAILQLLASGQLYVRPLISQVISFENAVDAYASENAKAGLAKIFDYTSNVALKTNNPGFRQLEFAPARCVTGMIGAGNFVRATMLPLLKGKCIKYIASEGGLSAADLALKYKISQATADYHKVLEDKEVDLVIIATRHDQHASMVIHALQANKHVFVEKPLAITPKELESVIEIWPGSDKSVTIGFNRRFSPYLVKMRKLLGDACMNVIVTVNAGRLPEDHWLHDPKVGGGRLIGEACHFIDLVSFLTRSKIKAVCASSNNANLPGSMDQADILLKCANGSTGTVHYYSNGSKNYQKERIEVYSGGRTLVLDDFGKLTGYGFLAFSKLKVGKQKGHRELFEQLFQTIEQGGKPLISPLEIINTTRSTFAVLESLQKGCWIEVE